MLTPLLAPSQISVVQDNASGYHWACGNTQGLVILDWAFSMRQRHGLIKKIRECSPKISILVIVDTLAQMASARKTGVGTVLLNGFSFNEFVSVVDSHQRLISKDDGWS